MNAPVTGSDLFAPLAGQGCLFTLLCPPQSTKQGLLLQSPIFFFIRISSPGAHLFQIPIYTQNSWFHPADGLPSPSTSYFFAPTMTRRRVFKSAASTSSSNISHHSSDNDRDKALPVREKGATTDDGATPSPQPTVEIHPLPSNEGIIVRVTPPAEPAEGTMKRTPCDIVLVIDVSGSMDDPAPIPHEPGEPVEDNGLSVLDLTKHAAKTILETLDENDRLGIVTFSMQGKVGLAVFA